MNARFAAPVALLAIGGITANAAEIDLSAITTAAEAAASEDLGRARQHAGAAIESCDSSAKPLSCRAQTHLALAKLFSQASAMDLAETHAESGVAESEKIGDDIVLVAAIVLYAKIAAMAGSIADAESAISRGRAIAEKARMKELQQMLNGPQSIVYFSQGRYAEAVVAQRSFVELSEASDSRAPELASEWLMLAAFEHAANQPEAAITSAKKALSIAEASGDKQLIMTIRSQLAELGGDADPN